MSSGGEAVVHAGAADLAAVLGPVLRAGLDHGDDVVLLCAGERSAALEAAAGGGPRVLAPLQAWRRPTAAISTYLEMAEHAAAADRELLVVSDAEFGAGPVEWSEWARFEAASHHATRNFPVRRFCLVDEDEAPADVVAAAVRLHPAVRRHGTVEPSPGYAGPEASVRRDGYVDADPLEAGRPTLDLDELTGVGDLPAMRHAFTAEVERHGLPGWRAHELVLAVGELAANAVRHGVLPVRVRFWATPDRVLCTVTDLGAGFDFPLSCYLAPDPLRSGLGLYMARQLVDQMNIRWTPGGFTVRVALVRGSKDDVMSA